jgi:hypothetical protein
LSSYNQALYIEELKATRGYGQARYDRMRSTMSTIEGLRFFLIIANLIATTVACSLGITAGSIMRPGLLGIMIGMNTGTSVVIILSFAVHVSIGKSLREYCDLTYQYSRSDLIPPMRVQYFVPCLTSPLYDDLFDHYCRSMLLGREELHTVLKNHNSGMYIPPSMLLSDPMVEEAIGAMKNDEISGIYANAKSEEEMFKLVDNLYNCRWTKARWQADDFVVCRYGLNAVDMIMIIQALAWVVVVLLIFGSIPSLNKFRWAWKADVFGREGLSVSGKKAKAKR